MASKKGNWWDCYSPDEDEDDIMLAKPTVSPPHQAMPMH